MSTPDENKKTEPVGAKYIGLTSRDADVTCAQDEWSRDGGIQDRHTGSPEAGRFLAGMDTWKHSLVIAKLERDGSPLQGHFNWLSMTHFGLEGPQGSPELMKRAHEAVKYSKTHEPSYEHRLYRMSFKSGVQRLV